MTPTERAVEALERALNRKVWSDPLTVLDVQEALDALYHVEKPTYEYATPYKEEWKRGTRRGRYDTWTDEEYAAFLVSMSQGNRILVRRAVSVGEWEEVS